MTGRLFALGLILAGGSNASMGADHLNVQFVGEPVNISYVADPSLGRGRFRLENRGAHALNACVRAVWLEHGKEQKPLDLSTIQLFSLNTEAGLDPSGFEVPANSTESFFVGFPRIDLNPRFGAPMQVGMRIEVAGKAFEAYSSIHLEQRHPYNPGTEGG